MSVLLADVPAWFSNSSLRRHDFETLRIEFSEDNDDDTSSDEHTPPLPFTKYTTTRWLVRGRLTLNLLSNWQELGQYFKRVSETATGVAKGKASLLYQMVTDPMNYLYLKFAYPMIHELENLNRLFQSDKVNPKKVHDELEMEFKRLNDMVYDRHGAEKPLSAVFFPGPFMAEAQKYLQLHNHLPEAVKRVMEIKTRCRSMIIEVIAQMEVRLTPGDNVFKGLSHLSPKNCLSQTKRADFKQLPFQHLMKNSQKCEIQYSKLLLLNWKEEEVCNGEIPQDSEKFWIGVGNRTNSLGELMFDELSTYVLACLSVPLSNAIVERVFSGVTFLKNKYRNSLNIGTLEAILRIRLNLVFDNKCCDKFEVKPAMLEKFTKDVYTY